MFRRSALGLFLLATVLASTLLAPSSRDGHAQAPTVSLTASTTTPKPGASADLTASTTVPIPNGYYLQILDSRYRGQTATPGALTAPGVQRSCPGSPCTLTVSSGNPPAPQTFIARVSLISGGDVKAESAPITITWTASTPAASTATPAPAASTPTAAPAGGGGPGTVSLTISGGVNGKFIPTSTNLVPCGKSDFAYWMAIPGTINGKGYNFGYSVKEAKDQEIGFVRTTGNFADLMADGTEDAWVSSELGPSGTLHLTGDGSGSIDATLDPGSGMSLAAVRVTGSWQCGQKAAANGAAPSGDNSPLPGEPAVFTGVSPADSGGPDWAPIAGVAAATGGIIGGGLFLGRRRPPVTGPDAVPLYAVPPLGPADPTPWQAQAPAPPDAPPPDSPPTDLPQPQGPPQVLVDGPQAIDILKHEGWVEEVPRPDGSIGYRPKGTLRQYNDTPQGTPVLEHQPVVDGTVVRNLNGIAFNENPDGTFDCISLVVTQEPAPVPLPAAPAPVPATSQSTDTTPPERNELGLSDEGLVTAQVVNDMIRQADLDEEQREQEERIRLFQQQLTHPPTSPPSPPTPATPQNSAQLLQALGQPGRTVVTPDTMRTLAHELAPDSITSNGTIVATGAPLPAPSIAGGAMSVQVKGYPVETLGGLGPTLNVDVQVNGTLNVQGGQLGGRVTATGPGGFSKTFPNEAINKGLAPYNDAISKAHLSVKSVTLDNGQITIETVPQ